MQAENLVYKRDVRNCVNDRNVKGYKKKKKKAKIKIHDKHFFTISGLLVDATTKMMVVDLSTFIIKKRKGILLFDFARCRIYENKNINTMRLIIIHRTKSTVYLNIWFMIYVILHGF